MSKQSDYTSKPTPVSTDFLTGFETDPANVTKKFPVSSFLVSDGSQQLTADWAAGAFKITAGQILTSGGDGGAGGFSVGIVSGTNPWGWAPGAGNALRFGRENVAISYTYSNIVSHQIRYSGTASIEWAVVTPDGVADVAITRGGVGAIAIRFGTAAQKLEVYKTYTDASNYERIAITGNSIAVESAGAGVKQALAITGQSLASAESVGILDLAQTWNTTGTPTALKLNVTDTASNASSKLMDLQVGGVSKLSLTKGGVVTISNCRIGGVYNGFHVGTTAVGYHSGDVDCNRVAFNVSGVDSPDTFIVRDAVGVLAQRNGVTAQTSRIYKTYTDASNYERIAISGNAITVESAGTGTANIDLTLTPKGTGNTVLATGLKVANIPTSDPVVAGEVWSNAGILTVSAG